MKNIASIIFELKNKITRLYDPVKQGPMAPTGPALGESISDLTPATEDQITPEMFVPSVTEPVVRVQTWTVDDVLTADSITSIPANAVLGTAGITGTAAVGASSATIIHVAATAILQMAEIETWANTGTNLDDAGLESFVDNGDATATVTYAVAGALPNDIIPNTDDPALTFDDVTPGADAEAVSVTREQILTPLGRTVTGTTDEILPTDNNSTITYNCAAPCAVTLGAGVFPAGFNVLWLSTGAAAATFDSGDFTNADSNYATNVTGPGAMGNIFSPDGTNFYLGGNLVT